MEYLNKNMACNHDYTSDDEIEDIKIELKLLGKKRDKLINTMCDIIDGTKSKEASWSAYEKTCEEIDNYNGQIVKLGKTLEEKIKNKK